MEGSMWSNLLMQKPNVMDVHMLQKRLTIV